MPAHMVTCRECKIKFDANKEEYVQPVPRKYYHKACYERIKESPKMKKELDQNQLYEMCKQIFGESSFNYIETMQLAENYIKKYKLTYSGIIGTLDYFYNVLGNTPDKSKGSIGIVPYQYENAKKYFADKKNAVSAAEKIANDLDINKFIPDIYEIEITEPFVKSKPIRLFNMEDDE